jgi:hypothetical protein
MPTSRPEQPVPVGTASTAIATIPTATHKDLPFIRTSKIQSLRFVASREVHLEKKHPEAWSNKFSLITPWLK